MPRYFFNIHDGTDLIDRDGTELRDEAEARKESIDLAGRCIAEMGEKFWTHEGDWLLEVADKAGVVLFSLKFSSV